MPLMMWGVIQGRKEWSSPTCSRPTSSDPAGEPEAVELPSYFKVLQERLDIVLYLGLSTDDLSSYLLLLACSIRKNTSVVVDLTPIVKSLLRCTLVDRLISTAALHYHHSHQIKAPMPTWLIVKATPQPRDGAKKLAVAAYSALLLSPSVWQKAQDAKKSKAVGVDAALPSSPRITCMGQVKGRPRRCLGACRSDRPAVRGSSGLLERLTLGLFGRR
ncbi:Os06g0347000 [Oryza sativa Japonica Group]|uniref:Uncharacterized protein n=2 Tax=Oryza sativa subsp. japonica TaxID=39947 RepID=A3BBI3_ORYSJ|nr:hypothetical protein OsJ_21261 [Oryza sativa Japonica Group]BAD62026.1 hypothetical protein [Oryza sativa Japonica Group]BAS97656.1 Os06g0347000 [Oryza sativa Japonica Group]